MQNYTYHPLLCRFLMQFLYTGHIAGALKAMPTVQHSSSRTQSHCLYTHAPLTKTVLQS